MKLKNFWGLLDLQTIMVWIIGKQKINNKKISVDIMVIERRFGNNY